MLLVAASGAALAQDKGTLDPQPLPPLANPNDPKTPAKELFGRKLTPAPLQARAIGFYSHGCLAGGVALPVNGPTWQVMRLSRNRNWGHPEPVRLPRAAGRQGADGRLARSPGRRHGAGARRADADRPCQPSGRARRRHLADADAEPRTDARRSARKCRRPTWCARTGSTSIRTVWTPATSPDHARGAGSGGRAHPGQSGDQEGAVPRGSSDRSWLSKVRPGITVTTTISMFASAVRPTAPTARRSRRRRDDDGCGKELDYWFSNRCAISSREVEPILMFGAAAAFTNRWQNTRAPARA